MPTLYKTLQSLELLHDFAYVFVFWPGNSNIPSALTTKIFNNDILYLFYICVPLVITNGTCFIILAGSVYCTEMYLWSVGGTLLIIHIN